MSGHPLVSGDLLDKCLQKITIELQYPHLIPALNSWAAGAYYMTAHPIAIQFYWV